MIIILNRKKIIQCLDTQNKGWFYFIEMYVYLIK